MADKGIAVRISAEDAAVVRRALEQLGDVGERALKRIENASRQASQQGGVKELGGALGAVKAKLEEVAAPLGGVASALGRLGPAGLAAAAAIGGTVTVMGAASRAAETYARAMSGLEAVLKATGSASGLAARDIAKVAAELQETTNATEEGVLDAAKALATFGTIAGDNFKRVLKDAQDLTAVIGGDLRSATLLLGKVLDDPARGLEALRKSGLGLTAAQRELIESTARAGKLFEAQALILDALEKKTGGAAQADRTGMAGAAKGLTAAWEDLLKKMGETPGRTSGAVKTIDYLASRLKLITNFVFPDQVKTLGDTLAKLSDAQAQLDKAQVEGRPEGVLERMRQRVALLQAEASQAQERARIASQGAERERGDAATLGQQAQDERRADDIKALVKLADDFNAKQQEELRLARLIGNEREREVAAVKARDEVIKAGGYKDFAEAQRAAEEGSEKARKTLELAAQSAALARQITEESQKAALNAKATDQSLQDAAEKAAQSDKDRREAFERSKALFTAASGVEAAQAKQIRQLQDEAAAAQKATVEYDALTGSYRLVSRELAIVQETAQIKSTPEGSLLSPEKIRDLAERTADAKLAFERLSDQQQEAIRQINRQNELMLEPFKNLIGGMQDALSQFFEDWISGTQSTGDTVKRLLTRFASEIASVAAIRPLAGTALQALGFGGLAQQLGYGGFGPLQGAPAALGSNFIGPPTAAQAAAGSGPLSFLQGITSFLGPYGTAAAAIGIPLVGGILGKVTGLFGGGGRNPDDIAREQFLAQRAQTIQGLQGTINSFVARGSGPESDIGQRVRAINDETQALAQQLFDLNEVSRNGEIYAAGGQQAAKAVKSWLDGIKDSTLAITDVGGEQARSLGKTADDLRKAAREVNQGYDEVEALIAAQAKQARDQLDQANALALGQLTGDPRAALADQQRQQQDRLRQAESLGADLALAEQRNAAERLALLASFSDAQIALLDDQSKAQAALAREAADATSALAQGAAAFRSFQATVDDFTKALQLGDSSPLSAGAKYGLAQSAFEQDAVKALAGDAQAIARIQQEGGAFVQASRAQYGSSDQAQIDFQRVLDVMAQLKDLAPGLAASLDSQAIQNQKDAIEQLVDAQHQAAAAAQAQAQAEEAQRQAALATDYAPGYGPAASAQAAQAQASAAAAQATAGAGASAGPSQAVLDALAWALWGHPTFAGAGAAQQSILAATQGNPSYYLNAAGSEAATAAAELVKQGLYSFIDISNGGYGFLVPGAAANVLQYVANNLRQGGSDEGLGPSPSPSPTADTRDQQMQDLRDKAQSVFSELGTLFGITGPTTTSIPGLPTQNSGLAAAVASIQGVLADLREKSPSLAEMFSDLSIASLGLFSDLMGKNISDLKSFADALNDVAGKEATGLGGVPGTNATGNPADAEVGFALGGTVPRDMLALVHADEEVINPRSARRFRPLLKAINDDPGTILASSGGGAAEVRALNAKVDRLNELVAALLAEQKGANDEAAEQREETNKRLTARRAMVGSRSG